MSITNNVPYGFELEAMPLGAFGGVGGFRMKPIPGSLQLHGGGVKKALGAVAAITVAVVAPYAVPALAGVIAGSAAAAGAVSFAAAGAIYGAAGGALTAALGGNNVAKGALIGGAIGGVGGYMGAPSADAVSGAGALGPTTEAAAAGQMVGGAPSLAPTVSAPTVSAGGGIAGSNVAGVSDIASQVAGGPAVGLSTGGTNALGTQLSGANIGGSGIQSVGVPQPAGLNLGTTPTGLGPTTQAVQAGQLATAPVGGAQAASDTSILGRIKSAGGAVVDRVGQAGSAIADRFTDPAMLAELTLRAAGQMAGSSIAGDGLSEEQQQLVDMQMNELQNLRKNNQAAFNQRLESAQALVGEADYFDPEYFGLQRARKQQIAGAQAKREGTRGLTGEKRRAESRRYDIETGRNVGTAYDQGYLTGVEGRLQTRQAGLNAMPMPNQYTTSYSGMEDTLRANEEQRLAAARNVGSLFGDITGSAKSRSTG